MDISSTPYGLAEIGTPLAGGHITGRTCTAYRVAMPDGTEQFIGFATVHKLRPVEPLITLTGTWS